MDITEVEIGTKLELELFNEDGLGLENKLISELEGIVDNNKAMIAAPIHEGLIFPIRIGTVINIYFTVKRDGNIDLYRFAAMIIGRNTDENVALLKIEINNEFEKLQRRKYYRLDCSVNAKYRLVNSFNESKNDGTQYKKTLAINLSGCGICLLLEDKIDTEQFVECEISIEENRTIRFFGKVIRYEKNQVESMFRFLAGIAYVRIEDKDREAVVRYIFNEQRILRKKGLI